MYVSPGTEPPWRFWDRSPNARPMVALAWSYGPIAPMPLFMPSSARIGPFTTAMAAYEVVLECRAVTPLAASARITGR